MKNRIFLLSGAIIALSGSCIQASGQEWSQLTDRLRRATAPPQATFGNSHSFVQQRVNADDFVGSGGSCQDPNLYSSLQSGVAIYNAGNRDSRTSLEEARDHLEKIELKREAIDAIGQIGSYPKIGSFPLLAVVSTQYSKNPFLRKFISKGHF